MISSPSALHIQCEKLSLWVAIATEWPAKCRVSLHCLMTVCDLMILKIILILCASNRAHSHFGKAMYVLASPSSITAFGAQLIWTECNSDIVYSSKILDLRQNCKIVWPCLTCFICHLSCWISDHSYIYKQIPVYTKFSPLSKYCFNIGF